MKFKLTIVITLILISCVSTRHKKERYKLLTCIVSQTSTSCDVYTVDIFKDRSLNVVFGEKEYNGDGYVQILQEKRLSLTKEEYKKIKELNERIVNLSEFENKCMNKGGWQIDIYANGKRFNFCNGEQLNTPLEDLYQEVKRLSPLPFDLHWGGCPN